MWESAVKTENQNTNKQQQKTQKKKKKKPLTLLNPRAPTSLIHRIPFVVPFLHGKTF